MFFVVTGIEYWQLNYFNYALLEFIDSCSRGLPNISEDILIEMLNVDILMHRNGFLYYTKRDDNHRVLIGSLATRIFQIVDKQ